ncbi:isoleucine--tRNA ligase [Pontivivens insulae]|uniref:Isoleucine--tRNA ligase n=1 Tax=Pontivivens insulae TaxID=1639689 RepID=A0A2R8AFE5_9RHOB|nr:isoleucine--tRNA ligase [Pontivivens insulae]RED12072.1 isoleucyl-tRNA synthetase [Pontivivens insulae]SPF30828.1 Isoleucine--tRNA ligase [Pontivivens insulae]
MCADTPEYKDTLNLPETDFPMRAGLPKREPEWLARWADLNVYDTLRARAEGREPFVLHDGPPYANGHLHIGHGLNKILKDMVVRSQQMMGRDARYIPGWDCHGLPIEWKIEEKYRAKGRNKDDVPVNEFRGECRDFAAEWVGIQSDEFQRLGITGDWANPYLTMDFGAEATIAEEFMKFVMNGTLYQGSKPVMWSPVEKTALAEAEVEYHDRQVDAIWVKFPVTAAAVDADGSDGHANAKLADATVVIWTTTPWTIPSNRAVCFGPTISYGLYEVTGRPEECWMSIGEKLVLADALAEEVLAAGRIQPEMFRRLRDVTPAELEGLTLAHPFAGIADGQGEWDFAVPMLPGDHVTDDAGTGFVHTAPAHGDDDYQIGLKHGLEMSYNVEVDGTYRISLPLFGGEAIITPKGKPGGAGKAVIAKLKEVGKLAATRRLTISDAHSWRSKAPVIRLNRPQWFVAIDKAAGGDDTYGTTIRERALRSIDELVTWTPQKGRNRLHSMIESRPDWVLSRQRAWGVPLTCFVKRHDNGQVELLRDDAVNKRIGDAFREEGADCWFEDSATERFLGDRASEGWEKVEDILDVWFDSGSTHAFTLRDRGEPWPADLYLEGTDQHRGWFHSSLLQACGTVGRAPYKGVLTHGFTLDEKGLKMSKSIGNTIAPADVVKQYGADILRLWVAQTDYSADQRIGPNILKGVADSYRRLRNTFRFILGNMDDHIAVEHADMPELERWVLHRLAELDVQVREGYAKYDFQGVFSKLFQFCTVDLSAVYFDIRKDALYCDAPGSIEARAARTVLIELHRTLTTWLAPILTFTMEEVWLDQNPDGCVHLEDFVAIPAAWHDAALGEKWSRIRAVRRVVTGALEVERTEKRIGASLEAAPTVYVADADLREALHALPFADLCITSQITLSGEAAPEAAFTLPDVEGVAVLPARADGEKCARCWKILPDVGTHNHAQTCQRCDEALS